MLDIAHNSQISLISDADCRRLGSKPTFSASVKNLRQK